MPIGFRNTGAILLRVSFGLFTRLSFITRSVSSVEMASKEAIHIDGSVLEGGGQILRNGMALSCLLGLPISVSKIRAGRDKPGLRPQHLAGIVLVRDLCGGKLAGAAQGSTEITFNPSKNQGGNFKADTKTAGSTCLLLQAALPCLVLAQQPSVLDLRGGTDAIMAPPIDYFSQIFLPIASRFGLDADIQLIKRGFYPRGGGEVRVITKPVVQLNAITLVERGDIKSIHGTAYVAGNLPDKIAKNMAESARQLIKSEYPGVTIDINAIHEPAQRADGVGTGIMIIAETSSGCLLAGSALGQRGVPAEKVGEEAAVALLKGLSHGGCVDEHLQDQLIIFMALASGTSKIRCGPMSLHTETAIHIAEKLTDAKFTIHPIPEGQEGEGCVIECNGIGYRRPNP